MKRMTRAPVRSRARHGALVESRSFDLRSFDHRTSDGQRERRGFVLPLVLLTTLLVAVLAANVQAAVWRSVRQARLGLAGERALHVSDAAISEQLLHWDRRAFASLPIGARLGSTTLYPAGLSAQVTVVRTSVDGAIIEAVGSSTQNGVAFAAQRRVTRTLALRNPPLSLASPLTLLGAASFAAPGAVSNIDETPPGWTTECAGTDSIDARTVTITDTTARRNVFDGAWNRWLALADRSESAPTVTTLAPVVTSALCAPGAGDPRRDASAISACTNEWGARAVTGAFANASPLLLANSSRHQGVLLVDGDLNITGDLEVNGLLMVRGAIDASQGRLIVRGAALVRDELGHGSRFGFATRVRYSRCALRRALSATGAPAAITTRGWLERF